MPVIDGDDGDIVDALGEISKFPWINVSYALGNGASGFFWGKLYGAFDPKYIFIISRISFAIGSAISGAAVNMDMLIVG